METKFETLWNEKFPHEQFPNIFAETRNIEELISVYDNKITEVHNTLKRYEFIKQFLENVSKATPRNRAPRAKPRRRTLDQFNNNCKDSEFCNVRLCKGRNSLDVASGSKNFNTTRGNLEKLNSDDAGICNFSCKSCVMNKCHDTVGSNANSKWNDGIFCANKTNGPCNNRSINTGKMETNPTEEIPTYQHTGKVHAIKNCYQQHCTSHNTDSKPHLHRPMKCSPISHELNSGNRCVSLVDIAHSPHVNSFQLTSHTDDEGSLNISRPFSRARMHQQANPINTLDTLSYKYSMNSYNVRNSRDSVQRNSAPPYGDNLSRNQNSGGNSAVVNTLPDKPVPIPRKLKLRAFSDADDRPKDLEHPKVKQTYSDVNFSLNVTHCSDKMSVDVKELPSVHSRIHSFEQKVIDKSPDVCDKLKDFTPDAAHCISPSWVSTEDCSVVHRLKIDKNIRDGKSRSTPLDETNKKNNTEDVQIDDRSVDNLLPKTLLKPTVRPKMHEKGDSDQDLVFTDKFHTNVDNYISTGQVPKPQRRNMAKLQRCQEVDNCDTEELNSQVAIGGKDTVIEQLDEIAHSSSQYENVTISVVNDKIFLSINNTNMPNKEPDEEHYHSQRSENVSDVELSDYSDSKTNSLERPKKVSSNSEDEISSSEELLTEVSLNAALTEKQSENNGASLAYHGSVDFDFSDSIYDNALSFYFAEDIDIVNEMPKSLIESDLDSDLLNNVADDAKTLMADPNQIKITCDDDNDSGLSLDRSFCHVDNSDISQQELVERVIDDVVDESIYLITDQTSHDNRCSKTDTNKEKAAMTLKVKAAMLVEDHPPQLPEKVRSYKFPRRPRHDYEEIKDFMIPVIDVPDPDSSSSRPSSLPLATDGKQRFKKRMAPKKPLMSLDSAQLDSKNDGQESSDSDGTESEVMVLMSPEDKKLRQRYVVIKGILQSEKAYLACLDVILQYMRSLEGAARSTISQMTLSMGRPLPCISIDDVNTIFFNIFKIHRIHKDFVTNLSERVASWHPMQTVGDLFKILISRFPTFSEYIKHYKTSVDCIHRCSNDNPAFKELVACIHIPGSEETLSLEDILFKPVHRLQRNTLVLHDIIKCTPPDHPDHNQLDRTLRLSKQNLGEFDTNSKSSNTKENERRLIRNSFIVELVGGTRKLRYIFLFSDIIVCTKRKLNSRHKCSFEVKWFIPLAQLSVDRRIDTGDSKLETVNIEELKKKVSQMKAEIRREMKYQKSSQKRWLHPGQKVIDKLKKKLEEQEAELVLSSPNLPFKLFHKDHKGFTLLMSSDYEREEWSEAISQQKNRGQTDILKNPTSLEIHNIIEHVKQLPKVNNIGSVLLKIGSDDDVWHGALNVTIKKLSGLKDEADTYCCLELDSYGHFFMKAKTKICYLTTHPQWDEDFELDLDGSQTLRILCYRIGRDCASDTVLGRSALELNKSWLTEKFQDINISMNEISLVISIKHTSAAQTMKRQPSRLKNGLFGVKIGAVTRRERRDIPIIVTTCAEEIERRGMDEVGIYRVSGVTSDVQKLKKSFEKNSRAAAASLDQYDINAVTGILKLYFRELPEPLFTELQYSHFITTMELKDEEAKERCMISLLQELPSANKNTIFYLLNHLVRVTKHEHIHKMNCNNLATIFGPNLLRPGIKDTVETTQTVAEQVMAGAHEAYIQTSVLLYFLLLCSQGRDLSQNV